MASMRVHELAKEFDMSSGDLLDRLKEMKIPAKSHASMLNDAYVDKIRKNLEPEIRARAGALEAEEAAALAGEDAVLMGGAQLYRALLPRCERVLVTQVDAAAEGADAFFPNLDAAPDWTAETVGEWQEENGLRFRYVDYVRRT